MFEDLYLEIKEYFMESDETNIDVLKDYCIKKLKKLFRYMDSNYDGLGSTEMLLKRCAYNLSKNYDNDGEEIYDKLSNELDDLVPNWRRYVDLNNVINDIASNYINRYFKEKYTNDHKDDASSFNEVVKNTINRNVEFGYEITSKDDMEKILKKLFHEYFDKDNLKAFTSRYKSRDYVLKRTKEEILREMMDTVGMTSDLDIENLESEIKDNYINKILDSVDFEK